MQKLMAALAFAVGVSTAAFAQLAPAPAVSSPAQISLAAPSGITLAAPSVEQKI